MEEPVWGAATVVAGAGVGFIADAVAGVEVTLLAAAGEGFTDADCVGFWLAAGAVGALLQTVFFAFAGLVQS